MPANLYKSHAENILCIASDKGDNPHVLLSNCLILAYHWILILAAVISAFFLMVKVTRADRLEPESPAILGRMAVAGVLSSLLALVAEFIGELILNVSLQPDNTLYNAILYFSVVGLSEEGAK